MIPVFVVAASLAAGIIHLVLGPEHVEELGVLGWGFYLAGALQLGWAGLAILAGRGRDVSQDRGRMTRLVLSSGIAINLAILLAWVVARAAGLPNVDGSWAREPIGVTDSITAILELGVVIPLLRAWPRRDARRGSPAVAASAAPRDSGVPSLLSAAPVLGLIVIATVIAIGTPHAHAADAHGDGADAAGQVHTH